MGVGQGQIQAQQPSGRYVTVGRGDAAYRAFVPAPLPPALKFDAELVRVLSDADRAIGALAEYGHLLASLHVWLAKREIVLSAQIDGPGVDLIDLYAKITDFFPLPDLRPRPQLATLQQAHNADAAATLGEQRLASLPLSLRLIREMHERLFSGIREEQTTPGEFRRSQNWLGPTGVLLNEAKYVPPPPGDLWTALDNLEKYLHDDDGSPPLIRIAFIHRQFMLAHPFLDGNGIIGRMLITLLLQAWNLLPASLLPVSAYFLRQQQTYTNLLYSTDGNGWDSWLVFFLRGVAEEARDALARAKRLRALYVQWTKWANTPRRNRSRETCVDSFFLIPIWEYHRLGDWRRHADALVTAGFLQQLSDPQRGPIVVARDFPRHG